MSDHPEIWLEPKCAEDNHPEGRQWCQDDVFSKCPECGEPATRYIRADIVESERQRTSDLIEEVKMVLGPFAKAFDELSEWSDLGEMNTYDDLAGAHALLSRLEER
ncbi:hypothetical protein [Rhizobium sp.]|uniref:hypothetical protein n=1 Tax=Rhizobium sp. TaxID=391 RepID=UPI003F7D159B